VTITHEVVIWCDLCGTWERSIHTAAQARKKLKALGWTHKKPVRDTHPEFQDFCLTCSQYKEETRKK